MKIASVIMAGALALAGTAAFAQNEQQTAPSSAREAGGRVADSGRQMGQDAKEAGSKIGDAAKRAWNKVRGKAADAKETAKAKSDDNRAGDRTASRRDDTRSMGAGPAADAGDSSRRQRMDDAYENYKKNGDVKK